MVEFLGQGGFRLSLPDLTLYIDPYLSDSVRLLDGPDLCRQVPAPLAPQDIKDADWVLITHAHLDHCDPHTIPALAKASPAARFIGPPPVLDLLREWGISERRLVAAEESWTNVAAAVAVHAVPAAHPQLMRDSDGRLSCVGFVVEDADGRRAYFAGDTGIVDELIEAVSTLGPYDIAFLPVNEQNYFRRRRGIIGNMSVREAFGLAEEIKANRVFPCHWDMFAANSTYLEEVQLLHDRLAPSFTLESGRCVAFGQTPKLASVVIRTLNEARHLDDLLTALGMQETQDLDWEVVLVDSGSTDGTLDIAERHGCRIVHITREQFSFGRSLNMGCAAALGDVLVFISGHCVPANKHWLEKLCAPLLAGHAAYSYGRQIGDDDSNFSERRIFAKYYPDCSKVHQKDFYCNNANAAMLKSDWSARPFDEELTGLEDLDAAKRIYQQGRGIAYVAEASVFHHHNESWKSVRRRFQRESIALQKIMPEVQLGKRDLIRYILTSIWMDWRSAARHGQLWRCWRGIVLYRINQYLGSYRGNHDHRKLSQKQKESFFYPSTNEKDQTNDSLKSYRRVASHESK